MEKSNHKRNPAFILAAVFIVMAALVSPVHAATVNAATVNAFFLYKLSDFTGIIPYMGGRMHIDRDRNETYVLYQNTVKVFNDKSMEIYRFGDSENLGRIQDLAVDREGNILTLSYIEKGPDLDMVIIRCNYRGDPLERIAIKGVPTDFTEFRPGLMVYRDGQIYLADMANLRIAVIDANGQVQKTIDLVPLMDLKEKDRGDVQMGGFNVDTDGNILFTLPVMFSATVLSPEGKVSSFGEAGSIPGKFGVVSDITRDKRGNFYVADRLKSIVSVYDSNFHFLTEFGGRGNAPGSLIVPQELAIDADSRLYVTQQANRGVSVFRLLYNN
jgi:DNA-binding beta-propeller fold protein YncE